MRTRRGETQSNVSLVSTCRYLEKDESSDEGDAEDEDLEMVDDLMKRERRGPRMTR